MAEQWIVRVQGREYGPVGLAELLEWKREGRLIRENEVREIASDHWFAAGELPEVFAEQPPPLPIEPTIVSPRRTFGQILQETWCIYRAGFGRFLSLAALVVIPSVCAQLSSAAVGTAGSELSARAGVAALFNLLMLMLGLVAWPLYIGGIQILSRELLAGRSANLSTVVQQALGSWVRVALLCLVVYGAFFLLTLLAVAIPFLIVAGASSVLWIFLALVLLGFQVWMFGRVFVNVLFWQQAAVLEGTGVIESLQRSAQVARSGRELQWYQRPLWRGVFLASIWCAIALAFAIVPEWSAIVEYYRALTTLQDPQTLLDSFRIKAADTSLHWPRLVCQVIAAGLRPLLGISFVVLYFESRRAPGPAPLDRDELG